jgi:ubiquinone/menaquinone biosynthesis C-methylase UbiE
MRYLFVKETLFALAFVLTLLLNLLSGCASHHEQPAVKHRFDDIDHWVKMFEDPERDIWQKPAEVVRAMKLRPGDIVADLGAGTGYFTRRFALAVAPSGKALGLDIEPNMVNYMNDDAKKLKLSNYEARIIKTDNPELPPQSVDVIFLCNTYHHIENRVEYFRNISKSLKPGGRVINVDFYKNTDFGPPRKHKIAREVVLKEMKTAGYHLIKSHDILPQQYFMEFGL